MGSDGSLAERVSRRKLRSSKVAKRFPPSLRVCFLSRSIGRGWGKGSGLTSARQGGSYGAG